MIDEVAPAAQTEGVKGNPFRAMETAFKGVYASYKKERAEYNRQQDTRRNCLKQAVSDLRGLVEQEGCELHIPAFRDSEPLEEIGQFRLQRIP